MLFRPKDHQSVAKTGSFVMIIRDQPSHLRTQCSGAMILIEIRIGPSTPSTPSRLCWHSLIPCSGVMINTEIGRRHIRMMIIGIRNSLHHHLDFPRASMGVREGQRGGYNHQTTAHCTHAATAHCTLYTVHCDYNTLRCTLITEQNPRSNRDDIFGFISL